MNILNLLYSLKKTKINLWLNQSNDLAFSFDKKIGFSEKLKKDVRENKNDIVDLLKYNKIYSEDDSIRTSVYRLMNCLHNTELTSIQKGLYLQSNLDKKQNTYNVPLFVRVYNCDVDILRTAVLDILKTEAILRMVLEDNFRFNFYQENEIEIKESEIDESQITSICHERFEHIFELYGSLLIYPEIIKIRGTNDVILNMTHHHILTDALSVRVIIEKIMENYESFLETGKGTSKSDDVNYYDFASYQKCLLENDSSAEFISKMVNQINSSSSLNLYPSQKSTFDNSGQSFLLELNGKKLDSIKEIADKNKISLYAILSTGLYHVLKIFSGSNNEFPMGITVSNRTVDLKKIVGPFISMLPFFPLLNKEFSLLDNLTRNNNILIDLNQNSHVNLSDLTERSNRSRQELADLFHFMFTMHNFKADNANVTKNCSYEIIEISKASTEKFGISVTARETADKLELYVSYAKNLYDEKLINHLFNTYLSWLSKLSFDCLKLTPGEFAKSLTEKSLAQQNDEKTDIDIKNKYLFVSDNKKDCVAIVFGDKKITYEQLLKKSQLLCSAINEKVNKGNKDGAIGILLDRSEKWAISILGSILGSRPYIYLGNLKDSNSLSTKIFDHNIKFIVTDKNTLQKNSEYLRPHLEQLETLDLDSLEERTFDVQKCIDKNNIASVFVEDYYCEPISISYLNIANMIFGMKGEFDFLTNENDSVNNHLWYSSLSDINHLFEFFNAILRGKTLYLVDETNRNNGRALTWYVNKNNIEQAVLPSALIDEMPTAELTNLISLRGEPTPKNISLLKKNGVNIVAAFSIPKAGGIVSFYDISKHNNRFIESKISPRSFFVMGNDGNGLPEGAVGELFLREGNANEDLLETKFRVRLLGDARLQIVSSPCEKIENGPYQIDVKRINELIKQKTEVIDSSLGYAKVHLKQEKIEKKHELNINQKAENNGIIDKHPQRTEIAFSDGGPLEIDPALPKTLIEALLETARKYPKNGINFVSSNENGDQKSFMSYSDLVAQAENILGNFQKDGFKAGDAVILQIPDLNIYIPVYWACLLGGIIPVTIASSSHSKGNINSNKLLSTWELLNKPNILITDALEDSMKDLAETSNIALNTINIMKFLKTGDNHCTRASIVSKNVAFYQLTSGSTGIPKCIQETHEGIIYHIHSVSKCNEYSSSDITLNWLPYDHVVPILTCHLKDTYHGCNQVLISTEVILSEPLKWLDYMAKYEVTHSWAPNFGFRLVNKELQKNNSKVSTWDLSNLKRIINAGEQVTLTVVEDFLNLTKKYGVKNTVMQPSFGMAEVCTCMTYNNNYGDENSVCYIDKSTVQGNLRFKENKDFDTIEIIGLGRPTPGIQIRITDSNNNLLSEGVIGRFQIKGKVVTPGYLNNQKANDESFVGDGWFNSGDLGYILNGHLYLTGREKEIIVINGSKFFCYEIEDVVNQITGVLPTYSAAVGIMNSKTGTEELIVFYSGKEENTDKIKSNIRIAVTKNIGISPAQIIRIPKDDFPKTTSGKIQRVKLRDKYLANDYHEQIVLKEKTENNEKKIFKFVWDEYREISAKSKTNNGTTLCFSNDSDFYRIINEKSNDLVQVKFGKNYEKKADDKYVIRADSFNDYQQLFKDVMACKGKVKSILYATPYNYSKKAVSSVSADSYHFFNNSSMFGLLYPFCKKA